MGIEIDNRKINNSNSTYQNVEKVINGDETNVYKTTVYQINMDSSYELLTNKVNYNEFYKKYLNKFDELDNYAYNLTFPHFNDKKYEFTSKPLILGKKIVNWIFGLSDFPDKELIEFYNNLKLEFDLSDDSTICRRWQANFAYFNGDLKKALNEYDKLFEYAVDLNDFPEWYLDDICIDGRNIFQQYENTINKFTLYNKYQRKINSNKHKLSYPDVDRIKSEIFESLSKTIFSNKTKSKYTTIYGIGLENCFKQIQQLLYLTVFYGSITHMRLIRKLISNIMYMYAETFEDEDFYKLTLKMLFLSGEFKKYRNLYNKIKLKYFFVNSKEFINSLIEVRKSLFKFELDKNNIFLYDIYGRYINDLLFDELTADIYSIIDIKNEYQINIISNAFKAIIVDRLLREFKVEANIGNPQVAYRESITQPAEAQGKFVRQSGGSGQYGDVVLRIMPGEEGAGITFESKIVGGAIPKEYIKPVEEGVREAATQGILGGYPMVDMHVEVFDGSYHEVDSSEVAFHVAGSMALKNAVAKAKPILLEPMEKVEITTPDEYLGDVMGDVSSRRGKIDGMNPKDGIHVLNAFIPLSEMFGYATDLRSKTQGRATYSMQFDHYAQVPESVKEEVLNKN